MFKNVGIRRPGVGGMSNSETGDGGGNISQQWNGNNPTVKRVVKSRESRHRKQGCTRTCGNN